MLQWLNSSIAAQTLLVTQVQSQVAGSSHLFSGILANTEEDSNHQPISTQLTLKSDLRKAAQVDKQVIQYLDIVPARGEKIKMAAIGWGKPQCRFELRCGSSHRKERVCFPEANINHALGAYPVGIIFNLVWYL